MKNLLAFICFFLLVNTTIKAQKTTEEGQGGTKTTTTTTTTTANPFNNVKKSSNGLFSIDVPTYMAEAADLNDVASLQYSNPAKEMYVIVIDDDKVELGGKYTLDSYFNFAKSNIVNGIQSAKEIPQNVSSINGMPSRQEAITGLFSDLGVYYFLTVVESPTHFYQIMSWTLADNKSLYGDDIKKMAGSFKAK